MPGRSRSPTPAMSGKRASRPLTSVPRRLPAPGCTTRPAGLSTTMTASSAWTTTNSTSASGSGGSTTGIAAVSIATTAPVRTRSLPLVTVTPSTLTPPAATTAADAARLTSTSSATTRSSRSPSSAVGIVSTTARRLAVALVHPWHCDSSIRRRCTSEPKTVLTIARSRLARS